MCRYTLIDGKMFGVQDDYMYHSNVGTCELII
jgi:hypothetical protein